MRQWGANRLIEFSLFGAGRDLSASAPQDVTVILQAGQEGDESASKRLLPLVYDELRKLARSRMANEPSDHTLQATALVHEAYLRLVGGQPVAVKNEWNFAKVWLYTELGEDDELAG